MRRASGRQPQARRAKVQRANAASHWLNVLMGAVCTDTCYSGATAHRVTASSSLRMEPLGVNGSPVASVCNVSASADSRSLPCTKTTLQRVYPCEAFPVHLLRNLPGSRSIGISISARTCSSHGHQIRQLTVNHRESARNAASRAARMTEQGETRPAGQAEVARAASTRCFVKRASASDTESELG
ncbi:hypothetical protein SAMN02787142_0632 [Burkholderia sp. WP9]|nr:hypothetical protein SAMN02787142_0632 [Burkholderia sp. WP9]